MIKRSVVSRISGIILAPTAALYSGVMRARNLAFDKGLLRVTGPEAVVVSVGNLSAGGTGKTPIVSMLIGEIEKRGQTVGVVSRGYGGEVHGPEKVTADGSSEAARRYGDEPAWLAHRHSKAPVFVGRDRVAAAESLVSEERVKVVIADDAFQHRYLRRDVEIVLVDATQPRWHYRSLPMGRAREGFASLARANHVFITKINFAEPRHLKWLRQSIAKAKSTAGFSVHEFEWSIPGFVSLGAEGPSTQLCETRVLLVSGIASNETFRTMVAAALGASQVAGHLEFADHHRYVDADLARIGSEAERLGVDAIVVTEKDAVKLLHWKPKVPCFVSRLVAQPTGDLEVLYEDICRMAR